MSRQRTLESAAVVLALISFSAQAQTTGGLTCPRGAVEAKALGAYYVPAKNALTIYFYRDAVGEAEMDAALATAARFDAGEKAKGPGVGKSIKSLPYVFKLWTRVSQKPGATLEIADIAKAVYHSYVCEPGKERVVKYATKEREANTKAAFPAFSVELKQGGKVSLASKGAYSGDRKDQMAIRVSWDIQGAGTVRVYE